MWTGSEWESLSYISQNATPEWLAENEDYRTDMYIAMENALAEAAPYEGSVWRGLSGLSTNDFAAFEKLSIGDDVAFKCIQSGTCSDTFAAEWIDWQAGTSADSVILHVVDNKTGVLIKDFSDYADQAEVLLRKNATYEVQEVYRNEENILTVELKEISKIIEG